MKKAAIITITNSGMNFGNRLQNYALQKKLESKGLKVETVYSSNAIMNSLLFSKIRGKIKRIIKRSQRRKYFNEFDRKYINKSDFVRYGSLNDFELSDKYDAFVAGSDQVWNPTFHFNSEFEYMTFADPEKRFSFSASFGVDQIEGELSKKVSKNLTDMNMISVREHSGQELVKQLANREVPVHVDPCMLLSEKDYMAIEEKPEMDLPDSYVLTYMLGHNLEVYQDYVNKISELLDAPIVALSESKGSKYYNIGPQHFAYLLRHATYVCTDSFHGTAFSIVFNRDFTVFKRKDSDASMDNRIVTLLKKMDLDIRRFGRLSASESVKKINYSTTAKRIEKEIEIADEYIDEMVERIMNK